MNFKAYVCGLCGREFLPDRIRYRCESCYGPLLIEYDPVSSAEKVTAKKLETRRPGVWKYRDILPIHSSTEPVSLGEGGTPLWETKTLASSIGLSAVFVKDEGRNPTGTFKDRGATIGVTIAVEAGFKAAGTVSHGNMGTSMAAYITKAGLKGYIIAPENISSERLLYLSVYSPKVIQVVGGYDEMYDEAIKLGEQLGVFFVNSDNPFRIEGYKTMAFEIVEDLGWEVPDWVVAPASSGGLASGLGKGFQEFKKCGLISRVPRMAIVQPTGAQPIVRAFKEGRKTVEPMKQPSTSIVHSLGNPNPPSGARVLNLIRETDGWAVAVTDGETTTAQRDLAKLEGIFAEPAAAISIAGLRKLVKLGKIHKDEKAVAIASGFGFRDPGDIGKVVDKALIVDISELAAVIAREVKER